MNKTEFLSKLERSLSGALTSGDVQRHIRYYDDYISSQVRNGKFEWEVIEELGEPRLLAKSIIDSANRTGGATYSDIYEAEGSGSHYQSDKCKVYWNRFKEKALQVIVKMPGWVWWIIFGTIFVLILGVAASILSLILPILLPVLCIILVIQVFRGK